MAPWDPDSLKDYVDTRIDAVEALVHALDGWVHDKLQHTLAWADESRQKIDSLPTRAESNMTHQELSRGLEDLRARVQRMEGAQVGRTGLVTMLIAISTLVAGVVVGVLHIFFGPSGP